MVDPLWQGTEPISYRWQWKPAGDEQGGSEEWQLCDMELTHGTALKIPNVQKLKEGSYQCVVSNCAGSQISKEAKLYIGRNLMSAKCMNYLSNIHLSISTYS